MEKFEIDSRSYLSFDFGDKSIKEVQLSSWSNVSLVTDDNVFLLEEEIAGEVLYKVKEILKLANKNKLLFNDINYKTPGILFHEHFIPEELKKSITGGLSCSSSHVDDLFNYYLFGRTSASDDFLITLIFNDKNGDIFLEIFEMFRWPYVEGGFLDSDLIVKEFSVFFKNYKPLKLIKISQKNIKNCIKKAEKLYSLFYENEKSFIEENNE